MKPLASPILFLLERGAKLLTAKPANLSGQTLLRVAVLGENPHWKHVQIPDLAQFEQQFRVQVQALSSEKISEEEIQKGLAKAKDTMKLTPHYLKYVFYLDPELGYAVRRLEELTEDGRVRMRTDCAEHQRLPAHEL